MYNKKPLREAIKNLDRTVAPAKKKDTVVNNNKLLPFISSEGYKQGPPPVGTNYRIPSDTIYNPTPYNIYAIGSNGEQKFIAAGDTRNHKFGGAEYVDEYQAEYGGDISIPDLNQYEDGGEYDLTDEEIAELRAGGYVVEELPKAQFGPVGYSSAPIPSGLIKSKTPAQVQKEELAKGKGPTREAAAKVKQAAAKPKKLTAEEQAAKEQKEAVDVLINKGLAAEMYGDKYYNQQSQNPLSLQDYLVNDPNIEKNLEDAMYNISKTNEAKRYQNAPWYDKALNEAQTFMVDPFGTPVRWAQGKRSLMGQAYRQLAPDDFSDTEFYKKKAGIDPDSYLMTGLDLYNPLSTGASAGYALTKGNVGSAALDLGLYFSGLKGLKKLTKLGKYVKPTASLLNPNIETVNNLQHKKGGEKKFSRSLEAKNRLFIENPLFKKNKSRKRKIFDPNAKYYQDGGPKDTIVYPPGDSEYMNQPPLNFDIIEKEDYEYRKGYDDYLDYLRYQPKKKTAEYYMDEPLRLAEKGGFQDDLKKRRKLLRDWTYGQSIGMLHKAQSGGPKPSSGVITNKSFIPAIYEYPGREDAVYTKNPDGSWLIKSPDTGMKWQPIDDPKGKRTSVLNKKARALDNREKVAKNKMQMDIVNAQRKANMIKNMKNEIKVFENEEKYLPNYKIDIGESTSVDSYSLPQLSKELKKSKYDAKKQQIQDMKNVLTQERINKQYQKEMKLQKELMNQKMRQIYPDYVEGKPGPWNNYGDAPAKSVDWVWTLPLVASSAGRSAITGASALLDIPATIGGTEYSALTAGNVLRGYYTQDYLKQWPSVLKKMRTAKTTNEKVNSLREFVNTFIGSSPAIGWNNALYRNLSTPFGFAENARKYIYNEDIEPAGASANSLRFLSSVLGKKQDGGDFWEDEIDDKRRKELEAQGYIIEDLD